MSGTWPLLGLFVRAFKITKRISQIIDGLESGYIKVWRNFVVKARGTSSRSTCTMNDFSHMIVLLMEITGLGTAFSFGLEAMTTTLFSFVRFLASVGVVFYVDSGDFYCRHRLLWSFSGIFGWERIIQKDNIARIVDICYKVIRFQRLSRPQDRLNQVNPLFIPLGSLRFHLPSVGTNEIRSINHGESTWPPNQPWAAPSTKFPTQTRTQPSPLLSPTTLPWVKLS